MHEDTGGMDMGGRDVAQRHLVAGLHDCQPGAHRHDRIVVPRALAVGQVAPAISLPCIDQGDIAQQGVFQ